ncbi:MAG: hypothetical protein WBG15_21030 [Xanthobacteraceae bacterium]
MQPGNIVVLGNDVMTRDVEVMVRNNGARREMRVRAVKNVGSSCGTASATGSTTAAGRMPTAAWWVATAAGLCRQSGPRHAAKQQARRGKNSYNFPICNVHWKSTHSESLHRVTNALSPFPFRNLRNCDVATHCRPNITSPHRTMHIAFRETPRG